jgi:uncharacterized protein YraI
MKPSAILLTLLPLFLAACAAQSPVTPAPAAAVSRVPAPTATPSASPTGTPPPPAPSATPAPIQGTLTIKVNVRSGPGTAFASLGQLNAGEKVSISVHDPTGAWYQILYPAAAGGTAWVAAQFVQLAAGTTVPAQATPTPTGPSGRVLQRLNVRSGPGLGFASLGMLEPEAQVSLTGRNTTASWFQIDYPSAPGGRGWVSAQYIQADTAGLPVLNEQGTPVAGESSGPTPVPVTPTPTLGPAYADGDSAANPGAQVSFSASGTRLFSYSSRVSTPQGDPEDWIAFTPYAVNRLDAQLLFSLACAGNGSLSVEIWQAGVRLSGWGALACGDADKLILLPAGQAYELRLTPVPGTGLQLADYTLTVQNLP